MRRRTNVQTYEANFLRHDTSRLQKDSLHAGLGSGLGSGFESEVESEFGSLFGSLFGSVFESAFESGFGEGPDFSRPPIAEIAPRFSP
jgi:hypothetical protein